MLKCGLSEVTVFLAHMFEAGGWMMYPLVLLAMVALPAAVIFPIVGLVANRPRLAMGIAMALAALGVLAIGLGALGQALGLRQMEEALAHVNPADAETIRFAGNSEARVCLLFGLVIAVLPLGGACVALGRGLTAKLSALAVAGGILLSFGVAIGTGTLASRESDRRQGEEAMAHVNPADRETILAAVQEEAGTTLLYGGIAAISFAALGAALLALGASRADRPAAEG